MGSHGPDQDGSAKIDMLAKLRLINLLADIGSTECVSTMLKFYRHDALKLGDPRAAELLARAELWLADATELEKARDSGTGFNPKHSAWLEITRFHRQDIEE